MTLKEILKLPRNEMTRNENLTTLVRFYTEELGREVCISCRGSFEEMINTLKKHLDMTNFEIRGNKYFRLSKEDNRVINNNVMTDELALDFLRIDPKRIDLFSKFPTEWESLLDNKEEAEEEVEEVKEEVEEAKPSLERDALNKMKLKELREVYPQIEWKIGDSKSDFITKILKEEG